MKILNLQVFKRKCDWPSPFADYDVRISDYCVVEAERDLRMQGNIVEDDIGVYCNEHTDVVIDVLSWE